MFFPLSPLFKFFRTAPLLLITSNFFPVLSHSFSSLWIVFRSYYSSSAEQEYTDSSANLRFARLPIFSVAKYEAPLLSFSPFRCPFTFLLLFLLFLFPFLNFSFPFPFPLSFFSLFLSLWFSNFLYLFFFIIIPFSFYSFCFLFVYSL